MHNVNATFSTSTQHKAEKMTESSLSIYREEPWNSPSALAMTPIKNPTPKKDIPDGSEELHSVLCEMYAEMERERRVPLVNQPETQHAYEELLPEIHVESFEDNQPSEKSKTCSNLPVKDICKRQLSYDSLSVLMHSSRSPLKPISKWGFKNGSSLLHKTNKLKAQKVNFSIKTKPT